MKASYYLKIKPLHTREADFEIHSLGIELEPEDVPGLEELPPKERYPVMAAYVSVVVNTNALKMSLLDPTIFKERLAFIIQNASATLTEKQWTLLETLIKSLPTNGKS